MTEPLTPRDVARLPGPGANQPTAMAFSPDGRWLAYLYSPDHTLRRDLYVVEVGTGRSLSPMSGAGGVDEADLPLDERLRRERRRELGQGVTGFAWAQAAPRMLVPGPDGPLVLEPPDFGPVEVAGTAGLHPVDPQLSPDGSVVAFVSGGEVHVAGTGVGAVPVQVTRGAGGARSHGLAEFVAQEEMGRQHGYWWSPDSRRLAVAEVDESPVPVHRIVHQGDDGPGPPAFEDHRYPFAGGANARVGLVVVDASGGRSVPMDLGEGWEYLARVDWLGPDLLVAQLQSRDQTRLDVVGLDPSTGASRLLVQERSPVWVNLHDLLRPVGTDRFLWASERSGFRHLELRSVHDGRLLGAVTEGEWMVQSVEAVTADRVWFTATRDSPLERHLYEAPLAGGPPRRVTVGSGTHQAVVEHRAGLFVDAHSSAERPPEVVVRRLADGTPWRRLPPDGAPPDERLGRLAGALEPPVRLSVHRPGGPAVPAMVYRPPGPGPFPTVVSVYGGPHVQRVTDSWAATAAMRDQYLRSLGFLVVVADNRGSAGRGLAFEAPLRWRMGTVEIDDQVAVVERLVADGSADPRRVGLVGWSYGGYLSALGLARRPDVFAAAVAGAPVTAWDGYDTHYTERYMGTPEANPDGYREASVMTHAAGLRGRALMLVHGLVDENVHFGHTARLVATLVRLGIDHELLLFPGERHTPRSESDRVYMEERVGRFLLAHLAPGGSPGPS